MHAATNTSFFVSIRQFPRLWYTVFSPLTVILAKLVQVENADPSMLVTPFGIVIEVKLVQPENADQPMLVTLSEIVIEVKLVQPENARLPIFVVFVITTFFSDTGMRSF